MKCIAVDTACLFQLLLSGYFTFLIYVVALLLAVHVMLYSLRHRCRPAWVFWWRSNLEMAQRVSDKESCFRTECCCLYSSSKYNMWWATWPLTLGTRAYDFELGSPICRFHCVHNSEVLGGGLLYFLHSQSFVFERSQIWSLWASLSEDWNQNPLNESLVSDSQTSTF